MASTPVMRNEERQGIILHPGSPVVESKGRVNNRLALYLHTSGVVGVAQQITPLLTRKLPSHVGDWGSIPVLGDYAVLHQ